MRIPNYCLILVLGALALGTSSCHSAAKPTMAAVEPPTAPPTLAAMNAPARPRSSNHASSHSPSHSAPHPKHQSSDAPKESEAQTPGDSIDALVAEAEKDYQTGRTQYNAGHLEAAKDAFDRAFDLLAGAQGGAASDPRVANEFNKIVDGVNSLEMIALRQGEGFTEQQSTPAPIDEANEITFPVDPNLKAKAAEEIRQIHSDLPLTLNDTVASYINYYSTSGRGVLERALTRAGLYRDMISKTLKEEGVPQDLIYLAEAESGFHPTALSHKRARGLWQFIASRAAGYGLKKNKWVDERQDPEKSTRAAARHLRDLYKEFGDWYLAMAAYNSGPLTVQAAVRRTGYADFWELYRRGVLPKETRNYVPIIMAVTIMAKNPAQYGLDQIVPDPPIAMDRVTINYEVDLRLVGQCVDATVSELQELNPSLLHMTTPRDGQFELHLPAGTREKYETAIAAVPRDMRVWWRYYKVTPGDTVASVARHYGVPAKAIASANKLQDNDLEADSKVIIPMAPGHHPPGEVIVYSRRATRYRVRRGDTLSSIADEFGVPADKVRRWNGVRGNRIRPGRLIVIHLPVTPEQELAQSGGKTRKSKHASKMQPAKSSGKVLHKVRPGETLTSIATSYNTTVSALRRDNGKVASNLRAGAVLVINSSH